MKTREEQLRELSLYIEDVNKDVTMILQSLQWDKKNLFKAKNMVSCKYAANHRVPHEKLPQHEKECFLKLHGYHADRELLPDGPDPEHNPSTVKLSAYDVEKILDNASKSDFSFQRGPGCRSPQPLTLARLQATFTADERRALHDAVVNAAPSCHDLSDLALLSSNGEEQRSQAKSRVEVLAELRDMKRRRTKYRVAAKSTRYSDVLRDVIKGQMEIYTGVKIESNAEMCQKRMSNNVKTEEKHIKTEVDDTLFDREHGEKYGRHTPYEQDDQYKHNRDHKHYKLRVEGRYCKREDRDEDRRESESRNRDSYQSTSREHYDRQNNYKHFGELRNPKSERKHGDKHSKEYTKKYKRKHEDEAEYTRKRVSDYDDYREAKIDKRRSNRYGTDDEFTRSQSHERKKYTDEKDVRRKIKKHHKSHR